MGSCNQDVKLRIYGLVLLKPAPIRFRKRPFYRGLKARKDRTGFCGELVSLS